MFDNSDDLFVFALAITLLAGLCFILLAVFLGNTDTTQLERAEARYSECIARENSETFCIEYSLDN
jgi:hypothetical protein